MKIQIRKRTDLEKIILCIFVIVFGEGILGIIIPQIHPLYYVADILNVLLLLCIIKCGGIRRMTGNSLRYFAIAFMLFSIFALLGVLITFSSIPLHLWGYRSIFTNFVFFIACVTFVHRKDIDFLNYLFWINICASILEIILGYRQDWFGGIYGVTGGQVNGPLNLLLIIFVTKGIVEYFNKIIDMKKISMIVISLLIIATFAELKIFYVELIVIVVLASLVTKFTYRKLILIVLGSIAILMGIRALFIIFPDIDSRMFSPSFIWNYLTNDGGYVGQFANDAGDINRLAFWEKCSRLFSDKFELLFGMGLGNCDKVELLGIKSNFYAEYEYLHYYMFPLPMILLQQGVIGMFLYILMYFFILIAIIKKKNTSKELPISVYQLSEILCIMSFVINIYDTSLLGRGGLLYFYFLALPFMNTKKHIRRFI